MNLFVIKDGSLTINNPEILAIESFRTIVMRNKDKNLSFMELAFVWYLADYDSPYNKQGKTMKDATALAKSKIGLPKQWKPDELILKAIADYKDLSANVAQDTIYEILKIFNGYSKIIKKVGASIEDLIETPSKLTKSQAEELMNLSSGILNISKQIPVEIRKLKDALLELNNIDDKTDAVYLRGTTDTIPDSADPDRDF